MYVASVATKAIVSTAAVFVAAANPLRAVIAVSNSSTSDIWICKGPAVIDTGILIKAGGGSFVESKDGPNDIYTGIYTAIAVTAGSNNLAIQEDTYEQ